MALSVILAPVFCPKCVSVPPISKLFFTNSFSQILPVSMGCTHLGDLIGTFLIFFQTHIYRFYIGNDSVMQFFKLNVM